MEIPGRVDLITLQSFPGQALTPDQLFVVFRVWFPDVAKDLYLPSLPEIRSRPGLTVLNQRAVRAVGVSAPTTGMGMLALA